MISHWKDYLGYAFPAPTAQDRQALEAAVGHRLPDAYWQLAATNQGKIPEPSGVPRPDGRPDEQFGVLLYALPIERMEQTEVFGYGVLVALDNLAALYPAGIVPFSDDTGGNNLAFDFRAGDEPAIVFVDHNVAGERGLTKIAPNFTALLEALRP